MVVRCFMAAHLPLTLVTRFRFAACKRLRSCLSAHTFLVTETPLGNCVADEGRTRIEFGYLAHSPFCVNRFKRQDTSNTEAVQLGEVCLQRDSSTVRVDNALALELLKG